MYVCVYAYVYMYIYACVYISAPPTGQYINSLKPLNVSYSCPNSSVPSSNLNMASIQWKFVKMNESMI